MKVKNVLLVLLMSTMIILVGCTRKVQPKGSNDKDTNNNVELDKNKESNKKDPELDIKEKEQEQVKTAILYFPDDNAEFVIPEARIVKNFDALELLHELQKGSVIRDRKYMFSSDIVINSIKIKDKIAVIDFDKSIYGKITGSAGETLTIASIINTLTLNKPLGIDKVRFSESGIPMDSIGGHMDTSLPMGPMKEYIVK